MYFISIFCMYDKSVTKELTIYLFVLRIHLISNHRCANEYNKIVHTNQKSYSINILRKKVNNAHNII